MATANMKLNISDCMADKTEIASSKHTFFWSRNALETRLITICCPLPHLQRYSRWRSRWLPKTGRFNSSDCMAETTEILRAKHTFLWSRNAMETKLITIRRPITKFAEIFKMASRWLPKQKIEYLRLYGR